MQISLTAKARVGPNNTNPRSHLFHSREPRQDRLTNGEVGIEPGRGQYLIGRITMQSAQPHGRLPPDAGFVVIGQGGGQEIEGLKSPGFPQTLDRSPPDLSVLVRQ